MWRLPTQIGFPRSLLGTRITTLSKTSAFACIAVFQLCRSVGLSSSKLPVFTFSNLRGVCGAEVGLVKRPDKRWRGQEDNMAYGSTALSPFMVPDFSRVTLGAAV